MDIGSNIRAIRKRKNITIAQICEETGLSQGFLSQVETNKTSPSIATLESIAQALKVPLAYLLLKKEERMQIVRKDERKVTVFNGSEKLKVAHLSSTKNVKMMMVEMPPGASTGETPHAHEGEEVHMLIQGKVFVQQGEETAEINAGDSFSWNACTPHSVKNIGDETAIVVIAVYTETDQGRNLL
ncbi:helix-turn-helix domain-containing protein [Paenibacillus azoreducens]|uniref:MerR family transcriptional regulator n=1 Tax=Paenibacillus azoreducens TaxID=116718 RepID=A0A919YDG9_9BACL|nr:cupin domain-containing protein [Paenibacillus azoreducens]GIO48724.1 MerR family transcriptional regulator [Paenibacillus azoreducens]